MDLLRSYQSRHRLIIVTVVQRRVFLGNGVADHGDLFGLFIGITQGGESSQVPDHDDSRFLVDFVFGNQTEHVPQRSQPVFHRLEDTLPGSVENDDSPGCITIGHDLPGPRIHCSPISDRKIRQTDVSPQDFSATEDQFLSVKVKCHFSGCLLDIKGATLQKHSKEHESKFFAVDGLWVHLLRFTDGVVLMSDTLQLHFELLEVPINIFQFRIDISHVWYTMNFKVHPGFVFERDFCCFPRQCFFLGL
mmetsp:Transcript_594/g.1428  ORF Transcript_594/g.1428 Transcript_594/m.1428 type:complete len:248 (-) Transcript_594:1191-1934(-)